MQATRVTLTVALLTVVIATPLGVSAAYAISQSKLRIMRLIHMMLLLPLVVPIIITAVGIFFLYAKVGLVADPAGPGTGERHVGPAIRHHLGAGGFAELR